MSENKRIYLYSNVTATVFKLLVSSTSNVNLHHLKWDSAYKKCCDLGMKLVSFDMLYKYDGVINTFKSGLLKFIKILV